LDIEVFQLRRGFDEALDTHGDGAWFVRGRISPALRKKLGELPPTLVKK